MGRLAKILPLWGRWQRAALTEGAQMNATSHMSAAPPPPPGGPPPPATG
jgi:hypothetical protein